MRPRLLAASLLAAAVCSGTALAGCSGSVSIGSKTVSADKLEEQVKPLVEKQVGRAPESVSCKELKAEVDATSSCTVKVSGQTLELKVTATKVDGTDVEFSLKQTN